MIENLTFGQALSDLLQHIEYQHTLAWVFVLAIAIGAILNDGGRMLVNWILAVLFFAICLEYSAFIYWGVHSAKGFAMQGLALTTIGIAVYITGLVIGWLIAHRAKESARRAVLRDQQRLRVNPEPSAERSVCRGKSD